MEPEEVQDFTSDVIYLCYFVNELMIFPIKNTYKFVEMIHNENTIIIMKI